MKLGDGLRASLFGLVSCPGRFHFRLGMVAIGVGIAAAVEVKAGAGGEPAVLGLATYLWLPG